MPSFEYLKPILGDELYPQVLEKLADSKGVTLVNIADGSYIPKAKFDAEVASRKQYVSQIEEMGKEKAERDAEVLSLKDQLEKAKTKATKFEKDFGENQQAIADLQKQIEQLTGDLDVRTKEAKEAEKIKGQIETLTATVADKDKLIERIKKEHKITGELRKAGAQNPDVLLKFINLDKVSEDETGKVIGLDDQLTSLKQSDPYLFHNNTTPKGGVDGVPSGPKHTPGADSINQQVNLELRRAAGYNV